MEVNLWINMKIIYWEWIYFIEKNGKKDYLLLLNPCGDNMENVKGLERWQMDILRKSSVEFCTIRNDRFMHTGMEARKTLLFYMQTGFKL